jgi:hypothetical protein
MALAESACWLVAAGILVARQLRESPTARLIRQLQDPDDDIRQDAARALGELGSEAKDAAPALTEALEDADAEVRYRALKALSKIGFAEKTAVPALAKRLKDDDRNVRYYAAKMLSKMGPDAAPAVEALTTRSGIRRRDPVTTWSNHWAKSTRARSAVPPSSRLQTLATPRVRELPRFGDP